MVRLDDRWHPKRRGTESFELVIDPQARRNERIPHKRKSQPCPRNSSILQHFPRPDRVRPTQDRPSASLTTSPQPILCQPLAVGRATLLKGLTGMYVAASTRCI